MDHDTPPTTATVDFAGSEVASADIEPGVLRVHFAALNLRSTSVFLQRAELVLSLTEPCPLPAGCLGRLSRGSVAVNGSRTWLHVPSECCGAIELELEFANGTHCLARGGHLSLRQPPGAGSAEHLHC